jgi:hypothetical protein
MKREQITIELESVTARLRGLRTERGMTIDEHGRRLIRAQEDLLIAEIELLAAHRTVLDAQDILSALGGAKDATLDMTGHVG